jgi:cell division protein FtsZ
MLTDGRDTFRTESITFADLEAVKGARIKVIGVGGGGGNAVNRLIEDGLEGVEFLVANTDRQALMKSQASVKIQLGEELAQGLGSGGDPEIGRRAALESTDKLVDALDGADMIFVTAGLGGGTGTGAAPIIGSLATELGALTVAVVTKPFLFEGRRREIQAEQGLEELRGCVDSVITIPNERLLKSVTKAIPFLDAFGLADGVLRQAVRGISDIVTLPGLINVDFADVNSIMQGKGLALMGTGTAVGDNRAIEAVQRAISSPLLDEASIKGARALLVNVTGCPDMSLFEVSEAMNLIHDSVDPEANIIFGAVLDERLIGAIKITVIATHLASAETATEPLPEPGRNGLPLWAAAASAAKSAATDSDTQPDLDKPTFMRKSVN